MFGINVKNGTNAGCRRVKPTPKAWKCCGEELRSYWTRCPKCRAPRPN